MAEKNIVEITRKILVESKGYPDPADSIRQSRNNLIVFAQDDFKVNEELNALLRNGSKSASKNVSMNLWTDKADYGKPEFIIVNKEANLAIVIECKPYSKANNHMSKYLRDENILLKRSDVINKYAMDGALHYAKFLSKKFDVIAIGISGDSESSDLKVTSFYWEKGKEESVGELEVKKTKKNKESGEKEEIIEKIEYIYGPFINMRLESIQSYEFYVNFINSNIKKIIKEFNEEKAITSANELNVLLDGAGVSTTIRALLVSGLLLALRDKTFQRTYEDKEISAKDLQENLYNAINRVINSGDIEDDFKKKVLKDKFNDAFNQQDLLDNNASKLRIVLAKLHETVFPVMDGEHSVDIIGRFYHEFLSYTKNGQNSGIKLTPPQITDLFCDLVDIKPTDIVMDICLGTGGFLISAMNRLFELADKMTEKEIEEFFNEHIQNHLITENEVEELKNRNFIKNGNQVLTIKNVKEFIRKMQLVGCEADNIMYTLGCSNMILRGDGKANILLGDCFKREKELKNFKSTIGFMNPPYSGSAYPILRFVQYLCQCMKKGSKVVVIVPTSAAHSEDNIELRNNILKSNKLLASISMSEELFKGIADTLTCIMIFETGTPHNFADTVYFGNWKEDGYYWHKTLGMIPDKERRVYNLTPEEYKDKWLNSYRNKNIDDDLGCWKKLSRDDNGICSDEWLWEYFVETDYSELNEVDFIEHLKKYVLNQLKQQVLEETTTKDTHMDNSDNNEDE
ncbi:HsdM family class I SAM-dependent methyltransferase [Lysinibacillus fusiformis]|uniref:HsdM family class I SAM-dependent methyltransferase n=1 Tax=Lysinibacillus fusiformis TaxID=28031 RepID=UPI003CF14CC2